MDIVPPIIEESYGKGSTKIKSFPAYIGVAAEKTAEEQLGNYPVAHLEPNSFEVTIEQKEAQIPTVTVKIHFYLSKVELVTELTKDLVKEIESNKKGYLAFKEASYSKETGSYEIDTKKIPKLVIKPSKAPLSSEIVNSVYRHPIVLTPTIENNDRTVRVNFSFLLNGQAGGNHTPFSPGVKVRIAQKILGDYIISGIDSDSFRVRVKPQNSQGTTITVDLEFDIQNAEIKNDYIPNSEWEELLNREQIAFFPFKPSRNSRNLIDASIDLLSLNSYYIRGNFSFSIIDGQVGNSMFADKKPGGSGPNFS